MQKNPKKRCPFAFLSLSGAFPFRGINQKVQHFPNIQQLLLDLDG